MFVVYVAGPLSGPSAWQREHNVRQALDVSRRAAAEGFAFICVHAWGYKFWEEIPEDVAIEMDLAIIERCDAILLVPGWERSRGTAKEIAFAHEHKIPVFERLEDLKKWAARLKEMGVHGIWPDSKHQSFAIELGALAPSGIPT